MLTEAEYRHAIRHRTELQQEIDSAENEEDKYDQLKVAAHDRKVFYKAEMSFYTNFLKKAIEEYEKAHSPKGE